MYMLALSLVLEFFPDQFVLEHSVWDAMRATSFFSGPLQLSIWAKQIFVFDRPCVIIT